MHLDIHSRCLLLVSVEFSNPEYRPQYPCRPQQYRFPGHFWRSSWISISFNVACREVETLLCVPIMTGTFENVMLDCSFPDGILEFCLRGGGLRSVSQQSWSLNSYSSYLFDMVLMLRIVRSVWTSISQNILFHLKIGYGDLNVFSFRNIKLQSAYNHFNTSIIKNGTKRMQLVGLVGDHSSSICVDCG